MCPRTYLFWNLVALFSASCANLLEKQLTWRCHLSGSDPYRSLAKSTGCSCDRLRRSSVNYHSSACGKFFWLFPKERREWVLNNIEFTKLTEFTITNRGELEQQLEDIRVKGFASEVQENELGASCIAAPIFGPFDEVVASISVAGVVHRMSPERVALISSELMERCAQLSRELIAK